METQNMNQMNVVTKKGESFAFAVVDQEARNSVGALANLQTANKTSLVEAINELARIIGAAIREAEVTLLADNWNPVESYYSQVVTIDGVTPNSQVDLTPSVEQLDIFHDKDLAFVTKNVGGVVTVYAIGQRPENDYVIQATIKEVTL